VFQARSFPSIKVQTMSRTPRLINMPLISVDAEGPWAQLSLRGFACVVLLLACDGQGGSNRDAGVPDSAKSDASKSSDGPGKLPEFSISVALASDLEPEAPGTVGIVRWSLQDVVPESAEIRFGLGSDYGMVAPVDLSEPEHRTLLLGMKPNRTYHFQVVATKGSNRYQSADRTLKTGPASNLVNVEAVIDDPSAHVPGFIVSTFGQPPTGMTMSQFMETGSMVFILDADGDVVWWYQSKVGLTPRARMSYDGKAMWLIPERTDFNGAEIELVTMDTLKSTLYGDLMASHDATVVDNDDVLAFIDYGSETDCPSVYELHKDGTKVEIFESSDYLPNMVLPDCHLNSIRYNKTKALYTVSDRLTDIFALDRQGKVQWRLGDIVPSVRYGGQQHGQQLLTNSILLFANLGGDGGSSAALEFSLSDGKELFRYDPGIFSVWYGDVQRLPRGNTLVTFSMAGRIQEVDSHGHLAMEVSGEMFGYTEWRSTLYGPPSDIQP
jgi:hypothetical protein